MPEALLHDLLPGAVTLVFRRKPELNPNFNPYTELVGIRIPNYPFVQQIATEAGSPIALTSANVSAGKSTLCVKVRIMDVATMGGRAHH